jgi:hypothetical protein
LRLKRQSLAASEKLSEYGPLPVVVCVPDGDFDGKRD